MTFTTASNTALTTLTTDLAIADITVKRDYRPLVLSKLRGRPARLVDVGRTRAVLDYGEPIGPYTFPITWILLPGSVEPDPRQRELFP